MPKTAQPLDAAAHKTYRTAVGKLLFIAHQRPDIQFAVNALARQVAAPTTHDDKSLRHLARYLVGTQSRVQMLVPMRPSLPKGTLLLQGFSDADWATDLVDRRSVSGFALQLCGVTLLTSSKKQSAIALSSCEAELYAIASCAKELLGVRTLLLELGFQVVARLGTDSEAARAVAGRRGLGALKHVELRRLAVQSWVRENKLTIHREPGQHNPADLMTKYLAADRLQMLSVLLGLSPLEDS